MKGVGRKAHQVVDRGCAYCVDQLHDQLNGEDDEEKGGHLGRVKGVELRD